MWLVGVTVCVVFFLGGETKVAKGRTRKKKKKGREEEETKENYIIKLTKDPLMGLGNDPSGDRN